MRGCAYAQDMLKDMLIEGRAWRQCSLSEGMRTARHGMLNIA